MTHQNTISAEKSARSLPGVFLMTDSFDTGGSERQFATLAKSLDAGSFRIGLGCLTKRGAFLQGLGEVTEYPLGGSFYSARSIGARVRLARYFRRSEITIAHAFDFYTNLALIPVARLARVPVVIGSQRQIGDLLTPAKSRAQLIVLRCCDRVVCNSHAAAKQLMQQGIPEPRIAVIPNGLPPLNFAPVAPALTRRDTLLRVGMIARMNTESKNHRIFLRVAARLRGVCPGLEFVLVGDGPLRPEFERLANDLGIGDRVRFLGDRQDIPAILASIDVSILPSDSESLSNVILESMAAGVPVVASHVGGNPELITDGRGILVPPRDEQKLASAVDLLLRDGAMRAALGREAKQFAEQHFTIAQMRRRHEELYAELIATKAPKKFHSFVLPNGKATAAPLSVAIVAASMRYVGGQSVQADLLMTYWRNDTAIEASFIPIDPPFPAGLKWAENVPILRTFIRTPLYLWSLWRGLRGVDIAHIFSASYWSFLLAPVPAFLIARLRGVKTVLHYHSGEARDHLKRFRSARPILNRVDRLIVPSGYLVEVFREAGLRAEAVPNIVDLGQFSFRHRQSLRPHLVCTRGFHPYYRVDIVVRAFAEVKRAFPEARLDLLGDGPLESQIRQLVKHLNLADVNFIGVAAHREIAQFYNRADIFINASVLDNMPVSILEAFASGTPVVSTAPKGIRYLVDHGRTGLLSEPGDATALAKNVVQLLENPPLSSRIALEAKQECSLYSWPRVRGQWLDLYQSIGRDGLTQLQRSLEKVG